MNGDSDAGTRRRYRRPPIQEALCQVRFVGSSWNFGTPAAIYERLKRSYPAEPEQQTVNSVQIGNGPSGPVTLQPAQAAQVRFTNESRDRSVVLARDVISVHATSPYPGWESFRDSIYEALDAYAGICAPESASRIGVRYINLIQIAQPRIELGDYFTIAPGTPGEDLLAIRAFFSRLESESLDGTKKLVQTFGSVESPESTAGFILDLDAIREWGEGDGLEVREIRSVIEDLRAFEREAFENSITDSLREVFDA